MSTSRGLPGDAAADRGRPGDRSPGAGPGTGGDRRPARLPWRTAHPRGLLKRAAGSVPHRRRGSGALQVGCGAIGRRRRADLRGRSRAPRRRPPRAVDDTTSAGSAARRAATRAGGGSARDTVVQSSVVGWLSQTPSDRTTTTSQPYSPAGAERRWSGLRASVSWREDSLVNGTGIGRPSTEGLASPSLSHSLFLAQRRQEDRSRGDDGFETEVDEGTRP